MKLSFKAPPLAAALLQRSAISLPLRQRADVLRCSATRRDLLTAATALAPCCCAICLSRTQLGQNAYQSYFASAMATTMQGYEAEVEPVKRELFAEALRQAAGAGGEGGGSSSGGRGLDILDLGCGALPNARLLLPLLGGGGGSGSSGSSSPSSSPDSGSIPSSSSASSSPSSSSSPSIRSLVGVDSNAFMFKFAEKAAREAGFEVFEPPSSSGGSRSSSSSSSRGNDGETSTSFPPRRRRPTARFLQASVESPHSLSSSGIDDGSFDVVLCTLLLCSVPDPASTLAAAASALRPGGVVAFLEHTLDPDPTHRMMRATQRVLDPLQRLLADGCHLTRDPVPLFGGGGRRGEGRGGKEGTLLPLRLSRVERFRVEGAGFIAPHVSGIAVKM